MKIIFLFGSLGSHQEHRVQDFIEQGYEVEVFAFKRRYTDMDISFRSVPVTLVGEIQQNASYINRLPTLYRGISLVAKKFSNEHNVCFFYEGLMVAMIASLLIKHPYIYEECDLVHLEIGNVVVQHLLDMVDKKVIQRSWRTIFTSEGFVEYHFGDNQPKNIILVPNKLPNSICSLPMPAHKDIDISHLDIAFVGVLRYESIHNFIKVFLTNFPNRHFHLFGLIGNDSFSDVINMPNFHNHGPFQNPDDLPSIYTSIDMLLCTYDARMGNVQWAEPNKLYEAIYFEKPIIVSKNTFLQRKVNKLGIGVAIDAMNDDEIIDFIERITVYDLQTMVNNIQKINKASCITENYLPLSQESPFFEVPNLSSC